MEKLKIDADKISNRAGEYFGNGFHCAEAVAKSVISGMGGDGSLATSHATAFGGGFGKSHEEACGALSGALIVIGHYFGRTHPGPDWDKPAALGADIRNLFLAQWGTTHCQTLCDRFGKESQMDCCRDIVRRVAKDLTHLLEGQAGD
ncbi:MAG: C-GCAxxG-C-C family protein [Desulfobacterales bacterium]|nr:C-GCAxxG-C-C family protein [Desulfobacterales bacterium]